MSGSFGFFNFKEEVLGVANPTPARMGRYKHTTIKPKLATVKPFKATDLSPPPVDDVEEHAFTLGLYSSAVKHTAMRLPSACAFLDPADLESSVSLRLTTSGRTLPNFTAAFKAWEYSIGERPPADLLKMLEIIEKNSIFPGLKLPLNKSITKEFIDIMHAHACAYWSNMRRISDTGVAQTYTNGENLIYLSSYSITYNVDPEKYAFKDDPYFSRSQQDEIKAGHLYMSMLFSLPKARRAAGLTELKLIK